MSSKTPEGYHSLTPHLIVKGCAEAIEFYKKAFGAVENSRLDMPGSGLVMHAELQIGDSCLMLMDAMDCPGGGESAKSPLQLGGSSVAIHLYVENVDEVFHKALAAGATQTMPVQDMFWGDRFGQLKDPFGHSWSVATKLRDMSPEEVKAAAKAAFSQQAQPV